jgi:hypothetical protein
MGDVVAEGDQLEPQGAAVAGPPHPDASAPPTVRLEGLVMLDMSAPEPVAIDALFFADNGVGVIHNRGDRPRILPWSALTAHAVEKWIGGEIPTRWLLESPGNQGQEPWLVAAPPTLPTPMPRVGAGALIGIQTPYGTYRFLYPGGEPSELSRRITAFAVRHQGPTAASTVTRVVSWGQDVERRQTERRAPKPVGWPRVQPYLLVALVVVLAAVVTLILLQSAGVIHLPLLGGPGGSGSGTVTALGSVDDHRGGAGMGAPGWAGSVRTR